MRISLYLQLMWGWGVALAVSVQAQTVLVKPYVQPGDEATLSDNDSMAIVWLTEQRPGDFVVEYAMGDAPVRVITPQRQQLDFAPPKPRPQSKPASTSDKPVPTAPTAAGQHYFKYTATLSELPLNREVTYRVKLGSRLIREATFLTRASAEQAIRFVMVGDLADGRSEQNAIAYQMDRVQPRFLVALGDIVYPDGWVSQYMSHFWRTYNQPTMTSLETGAPLMGTLPFYAILGNHDVHKHNALQDTPDALGAYHFFRVPTNGPGMGAWNTPLGQSPEAQAFRTMAGSSYPALGVYSFDYGPAHFLVLDNNGYVNFETPALRKWIEADLRQSRAVWKFVCLHAPLFHSSREHYTSQKSRLLAPLLQDAGVDIVFAGHVHNYQRSLPLRFTPNPPRRLPAGYVNGDFQLDSKFDGKTNTRPRGIIHVVSGGGGASLYSADFAKTVAALKKSHPDNYVPITARYYAEAHSFSAIELTPTTFQLRQINLKGEEVDRFTITKPN